MIGEFYSQLEKDSFGAWMGPSAVLRYSPRKALEVIYDYQKALSDPILYEEEDPETLSIGLDLLERFRSRSSKSS